MLRLLCPPLGTVDATVWVSILRSFSATTRIQRRLARHAFLGRQVASRPDAGCGDDTSSPHPRLVFSSVQTVDSFPCLFRACNFRTDSRSSSKLGSDTPVCSLRLSTILYLRALYTSDVNLSISGCHHTRYPYPPRTYTRDKLSTNSSSYPRPNAPCLRTPPCGLQVRLRPSYKATISAIAHARRRSHM